MASPTPAPSPSNSGAVPSIGSASCSGSASTSRSLRAMVVVLPPRLVERVARLLQLLLRAREHVAELPELGAHRAQHAPDLVAALLDRQRAKAELQAVQQREEVARPAQHDAIVALHRLGEPGPRHDLGVQAFGRHEQDREVGGERRRDVLGADLLRLDAHAPRRAPCARLPRPAHRRARALPAAAATPRAETWRRSAASTAAIVAAARAGGSRTRRAGCCRESSRRWSRTAAASALRQAAPRAAPRPRCRASSRCRARASDRRRRRRATASRPGRGAPAPGARTRA